MRETKKRQKLQAKKDREEGFLASIVQVLCSQALEEQSPPVCRLTVLGVVSAAYGETAALLLVMGKATYLDARVCLVTQEMMLTVRDASLAIVTRLVHAPPLDWAC